MFPRALAKVEISVEVEAEKYDELFTTVLEQTSNNFFPFKYLTIS